MSVKAGGGDAADKGVGQAGDRRAALYRAGLWHGALGNLFRAVSDSDARATLDRGWEAGIRYFDTAPLYGLGLSETRLNPFLRGKRREDYVISTKVGRLLRVATPATRDAPDKWIDVPSRNEVFDYSFDGVLRSLEFSLERLGLDRVDILYAHDLDLFSQGSASGWRPCRRPSWRAAIARFCGCGRKA